MNTLKSNISEAYKVQVDCLIDSESDSFDKNDMKEKVKDLVRLHEATQEELKTASYSEQIQIPEKEYLNKNFPACISLCKFVKNYILLSKKNTKM